MANPIKTKQVPFNGRLRTYEDPASLGPNDYVTITNLRYTYAHPKSIYGMSVLTSTGAAQNIGTVTHFRKGNPAESHVLVHAVSAIYDVTAAIPTSGTFGAALWSDTAAGATAKFAILGGLLAYANGVGDTCVYGGDEFRVGGFNVQTSASKYDFTEAVNNNLTDAANVATLKTYQQLVDANTRVLLPFEGNANDAAGANDFTTSSVTYPTYWGGFGSAAYFNGSAFMSAVDATAFNLSGTPWTIDFKLFPLTPFTTDPYFVYLQQSATSADRMEIFTKYDAYAVKKVHFNIVSAGVGVVGLTANAGGAGYHWSVSRDTGTTPATYRMFREGYLQSSTAVTSNPGNYTSNVYIGASAETGGNFTGYIDEFRISDVARWTAPYSAPTAPYSATTYLSDLYIGSIMPMSGTKLYVTSSQSGKSVNFTVKEWNGSSWGTLTPSPSSAALADNTATTISWANTSGTSKQREVEKVVQYWYQLTLSSAVDFDDVTVSRCTTKIPFQPIRDFWSGEPWTLAAFLYNYSGVFRDHTPNVSNDAYDATNAASYANVGGLTSSDYIVVGSTQRLMGIVLQFAGDNVNEAAANISVAYYNGSDSPDQVGAWTNVSGLVDGTLNGTDTFGKSGFITWSPPTDGSEFKSSGWTSKADWDRTYGTGVRVFPKGDVEAGLRTGTLKLEYGQNDLYPVYYYKITTNNTFNADVFVSYAYGIPVQRTLRGFRFPVVHQGRLWLCGDMNKDKNYVICSSYQSPTVLGFGKDNWEGWIGDDTELVAGASMYARVGTSVADVLVLCKHHETYVIDGNNPENYKQRMVSANIGCIAPNSMTVVPMGDDAVPGTPRNIAVWVSQQGVVAFDGNNVVVISKDINDKFDPSHANYISGLNTATGFYDPVYGEYHLVIPGSSEYVYDVAQKKWYTVNRGSYPLRCGTSVHDTNGVAYTYGAAANKLYRLEYGTTMAGDAYTRTLRTGEMAPESIVDYSRVNWYQLIGKTMTASITGTYYTDASNTAGVTAVIPSTNTGKRLFNMVTHSKDTQATFHGFQFDVADMFEPLALAYRYTIYPREIS